jgi:benzylsuccinate CoA-transferase BbsF subunit
MEKFPCEGLKILDFSWIYTGPLVTKFLANAGAQVVKVESPRGPDDLRGFLPYRDGIPGINRSVFFAYYNDSKLGMTIDLANPKGTEIIKKLVEWCDVIVEAFSPGTLAKWGFGYEDVKKIKSDIIMLSFTMQGQTGPFIKQPTFGAFFQSLIGFTHLVGWPDKPPLPPVCAYPDFIGPWMALIAILAALDYRRRTGNGLYIDMSQLETSLQFLAPALLDFAANKKIQTRQGYHSSRAAPHGVYRCKGDDRWCAIAVYNNEQWIALANVIKKPELSSNPKFSSVESRMVNKVELDKLIEEWTAERTAEDIMKLMQAAGISAGVVQNGQDLFERDIQLKHRGHWTKLNHPEIGDYVSEVPPYKFSSLTIKPRSPAPCLNEHNEYICKQLLRITDDEFVNYLKEGAFG